MDIESTYSDLVVNNTFPEYISPDLGGGGGGEGVAGGGGGGAAGDAELGIPVRPGRGGASETAGAHRAHLAVGPTNRHAKNNN